MEPPSPGAAVPDTNASTPAPESVMSPSTSPAIGAPIDGDGLALDPGMSSAQRQLENAGDGEALATVSAAAPAQEDLEEHATIRAVAEPAEDSTASPHDADVDEILTKIKNLTGCENVYMKDSGEIDVLPKGWTTRESRSLGGKRYYVSPYGQTQWFKPLVKTGVGYSWIHEIEVTFGPGRLGLNLKQIEAEPGVDFSDIQVHIAEIYKVARTPLPNGLASPAEIYNWGVKPEKRLYVGMRMTAIDGIPLTGYNYLEALEKLNRAPRPVRIKFADTTKGIVGRAVEEAPPQETEQEKEAKAAMSMQKTLRLEYFQILVAAELHLEVFSACEEQLLKKERELQRKTEILAAQVDAITQSTANLIDEQQRLDQEKISLEEMMKQLSLQEEGKIESPEVLKAAELTEQNATLDKNIGLLSTSNEKLRRERTQLQDELDELHKKLSEMGDEDVIRPSSFNEGDIAALTAPDLGRLSLEKHTEAEREEMLTKLVSQRAELEEEISKEAERTKHLETEIQQFKRQLANAHAASKREDDLISGEREPQLVFAENRVEALRKNLRDTVTAMAKATSDRDLEKADSLSIRRAALKDDLKAAIDELQQMELEFKMGTSRLSRGMSVQNSNPVIVRPTRDIDIDEDGGVGVDIDVDTVSRPLDIQPNVQVEMRQSESARLQTKITRLRADLADTVGRLSTVANDPDNTLRQQLSLKRAQLKDELQAAQSEFQDMTIRVSLGGVSIDAMPMPPPAPDSASAPAPAPAPSPPPPPPPAFVSSSVPAFSNPMTRGDRRPSEPPEYHRGSTASRGSSASIASMTQSFEAQQQTPAPRETKLPRMSGLLHKHPTHSNEKGIFGNMSLRGMRERWCEIEQSGVLRYYKRKGDREPRGTIALANPSLEIVYQRNDPRAVEFTVCSTSHQTRFVAKSHDEMLRWTKALEAAHTILRQRESMQGSKDSIQRHHESMSSNASNEQRATLGF
ncbi:TPA: hypothetical protein N0F65_004490 [Lagenidium giganteum]|uniref:PH domain-containing protein n=1 Tax=Lagenidium giganteum TaxID=4803 RepID=A0AAV2ZCX4_9STRA|nr:TPA: hypothetical protein N0F65_004490 [Lagenidium giganteum]